MQKNTSSTISDKTHKNSPFGGWGASFTLGGWGVSLLFCVAAVLFFGLAYPHHLHYQEQYQLFLFDSNYVWDIVKLPGGVADLLGRFCTQFFLFAWVGAVIIGVLLTIVQLLTSKLADWGKLYGLSYIPACLLWMFLLDENALLGSVWAVLITLLFSWLFCKLAEGKLRIILLFVVVPVLYWISGPVSVLFLFLQSPTSSDSPARGGKLSLWYFVGALLLFAFMLIILAHYIPVPASKLWFGIHYHRYPTEVPTMLWAATLSIFLQALAARLCQRWTKASSGWVVPLCSFAFVAVCMGSAIWKNTNIKAEKTMKYDFMACHQQWNRILETVEKEHPNNQIGVTVQNLALAMHGMLAENLFTYNQNGMAGLLPDVQRDATSPLPTAEAFYQLGMVNVAQRTVFEAQEAILDFQKSARCYKRLAQTNLINGDYKVARKYLVALQKTLFYSDWADETLQLLGNEEAINNHPEYGRLRKYNYKVDFYFGDQMSPDMLKGLFEHNKDNRVAYEYMVASYALTGQRPPIISQEK